MCIISPLLLLAPEVAQHASARNCNSTEWQFLSLPSTLTYSASHSNTHTHTHITYICKRFTPFQTYTPYNFSSLALSNHPLLIHLSLLRTPSINIPLSFTFSSPSPFFPENVHTRPLLPPLFPVFSADVLPVYPGLSTIRPIKAPSNWTVYVIHIKTESSFCCFLMSLQDETSYYVLASGYGGSR